MTELEWAKEIVGQRRITAQFANIPACDISGARQFQPIPSLNMCQKNPATAVFEAKKLRKKMHNSRHLLICNKTAQIQKNT